MLVGQFIHCLISRQALGSGFNVAKRGVHAVVIAVPVAGSWVLEIVVRNLLTVSIGFESGLCPTIAPAGAGELQHEDARAEQPDAQPGQCHRAPTR